MRGKGVAIALMLAFVASSISFAGGSKESASGQSAAAGGPVTLQFTLWSGFEGHLKMLNDIAAAYKVDHPDVSVNLNVIPFQDYVSKLTIQLAGSNPPDAGWLVETSAPTFVDAGVLVDLRSYMEKYDFADFAPSDMTLWQRGPAVYGIPFSTSPFIMLYNKDLFDKAGVPTPDDRFAAGKWTWEQFAKDAKAVTDKTGVFGFETVDGTGYGARVWHNLVPMIRAYGGDAWNAQMQCGLDSPQAIQAVTLFHNMVYRDKSVVPPGNESDFYSGNAAMTVGQISRVGKLEKSSFKWGIVPLPSGPVGSKQVIGQAAVVAFSASKHAKEAAAFVAFMTDKENVKTMAQYFPPARVSVLDSEAFLRANPLISSDDMKDVVLAIKTGEVLPSHPNFPKIDLAARGVFDKLWSPNADVAQVLRSVCETIQPLLKQQ